MKPFHSVIYGGWGIESRHGDTLIQPGSFDSEEAARQFVLFCDERDITEDHLEAAPRVLLTALCEFVQKGAS